MFRAHCGFREFVAPSRSLVGLYGKRTLMRRWCRYRLNIDDRLVILWAQVP